MTDLQVVRAWLGRDQLEWLRTEAKRLGLSQSALVRLAISELRDRSERPGEADPWGVAG